MRTNTELDSLERAIRALRIEYERYFNGALDLPPVDLQSRLERRIRDLRGNLSTAVDRFRFNSMEASYNSYIEMFNRRVRDVEEGRVKARRNREGAPALDPLDGVTVGENIDSVAAAVLYQGLYAGDAAKSRRVDVDSFRDYLAKQAHLIRQKTGCRQVQFRLASEDGKMKLKAKPLHDRS
jgi:hypothetical protein